MVAIMDGNQNINNSLVLSYEALSLISNFFLIWFVWFIWVRQARYKNILDENATTDADFAVMIYNLPHSLSKKELYSIVLRTGVDESNIVYTNKWFAFEHILQLKKKQAYWLQKRKYLEVYRMKKQQLRVENAQSMYPKRTMLHWPPFKKFPTEEIIKENWSKIESELLKEDIQEVKYWGTSIVVLKTEKDAETVIKFYSVNRTYRYCK